MLQAEVVVVEENEEEEEVERELASLLLRAALLDSFGFGWELVGAIVSMVRSMTGCMDWGGRVLFVALAGLKINCWQTEVLFVDHQLFVTFSN